MGLGAFGREVAAEVTAGARGALAWTPPRALENFECIEVAIGTGTDVPDAAIGIDAAAEKPFERVLDAACGALRAMLELGHYIHYSAPADSRGPRCDVFLVGDLSEAGVARVVAPLAGALAAALRGSFHPIVRTGDGSLALCPLLAVPKAADRAAVASAARALEAASHEADPLRRLAGRIYLVEDQSGKYLLSRAELVRSFAAFLQAVLFSGLRDDDRGLRSLIDTTGGPGPFATFACATLELDESALFRLCATRLAKDLLGLFRTGTDPSIDEIAAEAAPFVPERMRLEQRLWRESSVGTLEKHLEPPAIEIPEVHIDDSPEQIVEYKFSPLWRARTAQRISAFRDDVERFKMDRLAAEIERNGKACLEEIETDLGARIAQMVAAAPRGYVRAIEVLRDARTRASGLLAQVVREIESPDLSPFPASPLDAKANAVEEAVRSRPRDARMKVFGALATAIGTVLTAGVILGVHRLLFAPPAEFFNPVFGVPKNAADFFGWAPVAYVVGAALSASSTSYRLYKHRKRHQNWVAQARDELDQAVQRYLHRDVVSYFYRRLDYTRLLWVQRIYTRLVERIEEAMLALTSVRAAVGYADQVLDRRERTLAEGLEATAGTGGILLRRLITAADASAIYAEIRPAELSAAAERHLRQSLDTRPWQSAPFAHPERLLSFCSQEIAAASLSPFAVHGSAIHEAASQATRTFLRQLALKLSPPLSVVEPAALDAGRPNRLAFVPPEAEALVEATLAAENLRGGWEIRSISADPLRLHLLIEQSGLPLDALAIATEGRP